MNMLVHVLTSLVLVGLVLYGFAVLLGADAFKASVGRATLAAFGLRLLVPLAHNLVVTSLGNSTAHDDTLGAHHVVLDPVGGLERVGEHPSVLLLGGLVFVGYGAFVILLVVLRRRLRNAPSSRPSLRGRERIAPPASEES